MPFTFKNERKQNENPSKKVKNTLQNRRFANKDCHFIAVCRRIFKFVPAICYLSDTRERILRRKVFTWLNLSVQLIAFSKEKYGTAAFIPGLRILQPKIYVFSLRQHRFEISKSILKNYCETSHINQANN